MKVVKRSRKTVAVRYGESAGATDYKFWVKPKKGKNRKWKARGTTTKAKYRIAKLRPKTPYRIRVVARNDSGASPYAYAKARTRS